MRIGRVISGEKKVTVIFNGEKAYDATKIFEMPEWHLEKDFFKVFTENELADSAFSNEYVVDKIDSYLSPLRYPGQIRDFYAFEDHVKNSRRRRGLDMEPEWYKIPAYYYTSNSNFVPHNGKVDYPPFTKELDFEMEVGIIIGKGGKDIPEDQALDHIFGMVLMNDWSARDLQRREMKIGLGPSKSKDFAMGIGNSIVTLKDLKPLLKNGKFDISVETYLNGNLFCESNLKRIYWPIEKLISYASMSSKLKAGDFLMSGTMPGGCITEMSMENPRWVQKGDEVLMQSPVLGVLNNRVV
ncbi:MAG: fumarylacetoacetate hydrolase family protein [Thermoplasmataceae archaeon]